MICFKWRSISTPLKRAVAIEHYPIFAAVANPTISPCQIRLGSVAEGMPDRSADLRERLKSVAQRGDHSIPAKGIAS